MACNDKQGSQIVLAENRAVGNVALCACGTIHVSVGAVSLRLAPEVFGEATAMMRQALQTLLLQGCAIETANELVH